MSEGIKVHLMVATPMFGGLCSGGYTHACIKLQQLCDHYGIPVQFSYVFNESLVQRGRNFLVKKFLDSDATHLMWIDADIVFNPNDVFKLILTKKDIIAGPYPRKKINWQNVKAAILAKPEITPEEMNLFAGDFVLTPEDNAQAFELNKPVEVKQIGTGFMMITRVVIERYIEHYSDIEYMEYNTPDGVPVTMYRVFDCGVNASNEYLSEDYHFCMKAKKMGWAVWLQPDVLLHHIGTHVFTGSMVAVGNVMTHQLNKLREQNENKSDTE